MAGIEVNKIVDGVRIATVTAIPGVEDDGRTLALKIRVRGTPHEVCRGDELLVMTHADLGRLILRG